MAFFQEWFTFCRDAYSSVPVDGSAGLHRVPAQRMRWIIINDPKCLSVLRTVFTHNDGLKGGDYKLSFIYSSLKFSLVPFCLLFQIYQCLPLLIFLCFQPTLLSLNVREA